MGDRSDEVRQTTSGRARYESALVFLAPSLATIAAFVLAMEDLLPVGELLLVAGPGAAFVANRVRPVATSWSSAWWAGAPLPILLPVLSLIGTIVSERRGDLVGGEVGMAIVIGTPVMFVLGLITMVLVALLGRAGVRRAEQMRARRDNW